MMDLYERQSTYKIKVVIRIRPLNPYEQAQGYRRIVEPADTSDIRVIDPIFFDIIKKAETVKAIDSSAWSRTYNFDSCYWPRSFNGEDFEGSEDSSQDDVFEGIGKPVVEWILHGYNCSIMAYGQTGGGKSFTMMGDLRGNPNMFGLIPRLCFSLFESLEAKNRMNPENYFHEVFFSHLEIYNENVRDLLVETKPGPSSQHTFLKVREHPNTGVFVAGLTKVQVRTFEEVMSLIQFGDRNRTVASTNSNKHSSRSHAVVTLTVLQRMRQSLSVKDSSDSALLTAGLEQKISLCHCVDLAGSERFQGAEGARLKESTHINKSLSVLGDVIKCLGDRNGKNGGHIPYRNSTLTMILKESLGGNSHAVMITAVSPSSADYDETISSLKYAERAKKVRMNVQANITSGLAAASNANELVPILQAEVQKLRQLLLQQQQHEQRPLPRDSFLPVGRQRLLADDVVQKMQQRVKELEKQLEDRETLIQQLSQSNQNNTDFDEGADFHTENRKNYDPFHSLAMKSFNNVSQNITPNIEKSPVSLSKVTTLRPRPYVMLADDAIGNISLPRLINLNADPLFSECLVYFLPMENLLVGSKDEIVDIILSAPDILPRHCALSCTNEGVSLSLEEKSLVFVNGKKVDPLASIRLKHFDRISIGRFHMFRFEAAGKAGRSKNGIPAIDAFIPGWEFAQQEILQHAKNFKIVEHSDSVQATQDTNNNSIVAGKPTENQFTRRRTMESKIVSQVRGLTIEKFTERTNDSTMNNVSTDKSPLDNTNTRLPSPSMPDSTSTSPVKNFEREAISLQNELTEMQHQLQKRMERYQKLAGHKKL